MIGTAALVRATGKLMCRRTDGHRVCFKLKKKQKTLTHPSVTKSMKMNMFPKTTKNESLNHSMTHFPKHAPQSEYTAAANEPRWQEQTAAEWMGRVKLNV